MIFQRKKDANPDLFWKEYEEKTGENVLAKALGHYMSGWAEYTEPLWGLLIATSGGFRFHHFPHESWFAALTRATTGGSSAVEKTIFIPKENIKAVSMRAERRWWKRLLVPSPPVFCLRYGVLDGSEAELLAETDTSAQAVAEALAPAV
jgi:hypothetical protein